MGPEIQRRIAADEKCKFGNEWEAAVRASGL